MKFFIGISLALMGTLFLCLLYRLMIQYQLTRVDTKQTSILFQTKFNHFKLKELRKSFTYLFVGTMGLITILSFAILQLFQIETQVQKQRASNLMLQSEVKNIKTRKSTKNLLKGYPSSGLELEESLTVNKQTLKKKEQIEKDLSEQLIPYIGAENLVLSSGNESESLNILITGSIDATNANLVIFGKNITSLLQEVEQIKNVSEVHINIVDREGNDLYKGVYVRNEKGQFTFQSELRKGKG